MLQAVTYNTISASKQFFLKKLFIFLILSVYCGESKPFAKQRNLFVIHINVCDAESKSFVNEVMHLKE